MEKKIKFDDIINFIYNAIDRKYDISLCDGILTVTREINHKNITEISCFHFSWILNNKKQLIIHVDKYYIDINSDYCYKLEIENPKDIARWNILIEDVKEYVFNKIEDKFNNFFNEDDKSTTINDLDD